jgi:hypothetical protein
MNNFKPFVVGKLKLWNYYKESDTWMEGDGWVYTGQVSTDWVLGYLEEELRVIQEGIKRVKEISGRG